MTKSNFNLYLNNDFTLEFKDYNTKEFRHKTKGFLLKEISSGSDDCEEICLNYYVYIKRESFLLGASTTSYKEFEDGSYMDKEINLLFQVEFY